MSSTLIDGKMVNIYLVPSLGPYAEEDHNAALLTLDTQECINRCMSCTKEQCCNCLGRESAYDRPGRPRAAAAGKLMAAISSLGANITTERLAGYLGVSERTARRYLRTVSMGVG